MRAGLGMTAVAVLWVACGGGSGNNAGGGGGGSGAMTASIDGQSFSADQSATAAARTQNMVSFYTITGSRGSSATNAQSIVLVLYNIGAPGTYPLGVSATNFGGIGTVTEGSTSWITPLNGTSGTVVITSLTSSHIAGTFSFTSTEATGASSTRTVSNGAFDLPISGTVGTVQPYQGSSMKATLGGAGWIGATIVVQGKTGGAYNFLGQSLSGATVTGASSVNISLGGVTGPGTYPFSPTTSSVSVIIGTSGFSSIHAGSSGSVVVSSADANRLKGTFSGTLGATGGGSALNVSNGTFDIGLGP